MLDFPGPGGLTVGQIFTSAGKSWQWDGAKWAATAGGGAPLDSPSFTGDPKAPTPSTADNDTSIATTAFVKAQGYLLNNQVITLSGDVGGSGATAIAATLATVNSNVGTFAIQTVNAKGLVTAAANMTGDVTTSGGAATLATVNSNVGTFQGLTLDAKGRVTAAANQNYVTGGPYLPTAGGTVTGSLRVGSALADPGAGSLAVGGSINLVNNQAVYSKDTGGTAHPILYLASDNRVWVGYGAGTFNVCNGHLYPSGDNTFLAGNTGNAWANVVSYIFTDLTRARINVEPLPACLGLVQAIQPKRYQLGNAREEDRDRVRWGLVPEDVGQAMQDAGLVFGGHIVGDDEEQSQGLSYSDLTAVLWKAVQELSAQVAELQAKVAA
jgi:hypothetical protein